MAELFNIMKISIGADKLRARVLVNRNCPCGPLRTSRRPRASITWPRHRGTHLCLGDAGSRFQECMSDTELAHLLEHLSVEIMATRPAWPMTLRAGEPVSFPATSGSSTSSSPVPMTR